MNISDSNIDQFSAARMVRSGRLTPAAALTSGVPPGAEADEIGVTRIMLRAPQRGASAHVFDFLEADRLLLVWKNDAEQAIECQFALQFSDGAQVRGTLILWRETRARPALRNHIIRSGCQAMTS